MPEVYNPPKSLGLDPFALLNRMGVLGSGWVNRAFHRTILFFLLWMRMLTWPMGSERFFPSWKRIFSGFRFWVSWVPKGQQWQAETLEEIGYLDHFIWARIQYGPTIDHVCWGPLGDQDGSGAYISQQLLILLPLYPSELISRPGSGKCAVWYPIDPRLSRWCCQ